MTAEPGFVAVTLAAILAGAKCQFPMNYGKHLGCFTFPANTSSAYEYNEVDRRSTVESCSKACKSLFYSFALLHKGQRCYCDGSYRSSQQRSKGCTKSCVERSSGLSLSCGGDDLASVYDVGLKVPGPPRDLVLEGFTETSVSVAWSPSNSTPSIVDGLDVRVRVEKSFDEAVGELPPKHIRLSGTSRGTTVVGLNPGALYNVSVSAFSSDGSSGPAASSLFWTEVGAPLAPEPPKVIRRGSGDHGSVGGEIRIRAVPLRRNPNGPVSGYRIAVFDETDPAPFHPESLADWSTAERLGLKYYVAAEVPSDRFDSGKEFVVGDLRYYGGYFNYGPLAAGRDYHVTVGTVSTLNNVTKVTYAKVGHDQHSGDRLVVFHFDGGGRPEEEEGAGDGAEPLVVGLSVAIVVVSVLVLAALAYFLHLRRRVGKRRRSRRSECQELTSHQFGHSNPALSRDDEEADGRGDDPVRALEALRGRVWAIPKNFLSLTDDVVGGGRFGSVLAATVNQRGAVTAARAQVIAVNVLSAEELSSLVRDLEVSARTGRHSNVVQLVGMCEDKDATFVAFEDTDANLKRVLLESRALEHHPVYAEKNSRFSTLGEGFVFGHLVDVARGMGHLSGLGIAHRSLCARNVFVSGSIAKVGGFGVVDFREPGGGEIDASRWTAQECLKSRSYVPKCDVWSFGVLVWEAFTLGATPYPDVKTRDVPNRVMRGMRAPQPDHVSDDLYQLMLQCWQLDLDERPGFDDLEASLRGMSLQATAYATFALKSSSRFRYEPFSSDLELSGG